MTKKEQLIAMVEKDTLDRNLHLDFVLPYSDDMVAETIIVPARFVDEKIRYIDFAYDFNLVMRRNHEVKIVNFFLK